MINCSEYFSLAEVRNLLKIQQNISNNVGTKHMQTIDIEKTRKTTVYLFSQWANFIGVVERAAYRGAVWLIGPYKNVFFFFFLCCKFRDCCDISVVIMMTTPIFQMGRTDLQYIVMLNWFPERRLYIHLASVLPLTI